MAETLRPTAAQVDAETTRIGTGQGRYLLINLCDFRLGGGTGTIRQYLRAGLVDEMHVAISPILLGSGEPLFADLDLTKLGYRCVEHTATAKATHRVLTKDG